MTDIKAFVKKWNGRVLQDWGSEVSPEFKSFQTAFINAIKKITTSLGGELISYNKGHYDISGFIQVGEKYIYFNYDNCCGAGGRTFISLKDKYSYHMPLLIRRAKHAKDYHGCGNYLCAFVDFEEYAKRLLEKE